MAEGTGLEPASLFRAAVFKTAALPVTLPLQNLYCIYFTRTEGTREDTLFVLVGDFRMATDVL